MLKSRRFLSALLLTAMAVGPMCMAPASAQQTPAATQVAKSGAVTGSVTDSQGAPVANASVRFTGPATYATQTDAKGAFAISNMSAGFYTVVITKPGFTTARQQDVAILLGETESVSVTMQAASFSSLRDIASVRVRAGSRFNTTTPDPSPRP